MKKTLPKFIRYQAALAARLSMFAYEKNHLRLRALLSDMGFPEVRFYEDAATGTFAFLAWNWATKRAWLVVRGTEKDYADILTDLKFRREDLDESIAYEGSVHRGIKAAWRSIHEEVERDLLELHAAGIPVTGTGHSLGGGVVEVAAAEGACPVIYTQGKLRVGNRKFARFCERKFTHWRITRRADIVTLVPLLVLGFKHSGIHVYIDEDRDIWVNPSLWREMKERARALMSADWIDAGPFGRLPLSMFADHRIAAYVHDLSRGE